jgi:hypothetical protein
LSESRSFFCWNAVGFYSQPAGRNSALALKITQFRVNNAKEQHMRTLKISLVALFCLAALAPAVATRVAALTSTLAQDKAPKEKSGKAKDAAQSKLGQPVDPSHYVGGESCAECHAAEATHYALTAHARSATGMTAAPTRPKEKN